MANTAWNPSDKGANVTLSNLNLSAAFGGANQGVRATDKQNTGKFYFEITATAGAANQSMVGLGNGLTNLGNVVTSPANVVAVLGNAGLIFLNGASTGLSISGALTNGAIVGMAVDITNLLIWFRLAPSGNWNGNAGFAPNGTGGISLATLTSAGIPLFPLVAIAATTGGAYTANFGDSAFSGTVPSGYTSGWPTSALSTNALATQAAVEHWITTNTPAQVTQVAIEHWASVAAAVPGSAQAYVMVLA